MAETTEVRKIIKVCQTAGSATDDIELTDRRGAGIASKRVPIWLSREAKRVFSLAHSPLLHRWTIVKGRPAISYHRKETLQLVPINTSAKHLPRYRRLNWPIRITHISTTGKLKTNMLDNDKSWNLDNVDSSNVLRAHGTVVAYLIVVEYLHLT